MLTAFILLLHVYSYRNYVTAKCSIVGGLGVRMFLFFARVIFFFDGNQGPLFFWASSGCGFFAETHYRNVYRDSSYLQRSVIYVWPYLLRTVFCFMRG